MKATGEVMAIDRTFGSALNKALRGLEQAGVGPLAEDPTWTPTFDYLAGVYAGRPRRRRADPLGRRGGTGLRVDPPRAADRRADRPAPVPRAVRQPAVAAARPAPPRRAGGGHRRGDRHLPVVPRRDGPQRRARGRHPRRSGRGCRPGRRRGGGAARHGQAGRFRRPRAGRAGRHDRRRAAGGAARARSEARLRDGRHVRGGVRGRDAVLLLDLCRGRLAAGGAAGRAPGRPRHRLAGRSGSARASSSTTAPSRPPTRSAERAGRP